MCIRGVYDTEVGSGSPIITRLAQWKIVPKQSQVEGVDLRGASAPPWSSVNNCTVEVKRPPEREPVINGGVDSYGQEKRILSILESAESQGITITRAQTLSLLRGATLKDGNRKYRASLSDGLREQREGKTERLAAFMRRAQERGGVLPREASHDPIGYWRKVTQQKQRA